MVHSLLRWLLPAALCATALAALAEPAKPDPLDAKATVPPLVYESSFKEYRRFSEEKSLSWREANDNVARIGGWRAYARESQSPDAPPAATKASEPASKPMPHRHHSGHTAP